ncbi:MAG TPA: 50S ribosomal protein L21 [Candidatus Latescibacteria bacterium]|jgi:large subunit ribosomal protein L21|nr:50S ribosomal protein L21 [Candidatus Latescibacterota bacterium]
MYAVIRSGNQQFRVNEGDTIQVEKINAEVGDEITIDQVLLLGGGDTVIGTPIVSGATVTARVAEQGRHPKIIVFKMKRRKNYRRKNGHRQPFTALEITGINYDPSTAN